GRGVAQGHRPVRGRRQADGEGRRGRGVPRGTHRRAIDRDGRQGIGIEDRGGGLGEGGRGGGGVEQVEVEGLDEPAARRGVDRHLDGLLGLAGGEGQRPGGGDVVHAGQGGAVGRGVAHGHRRTRRGQQVDREGRGGRGVGTGDHRRIRDR